MLPDRVSNPGPLTYESGSSMFKIDLECAQLFQKLVGRLAVLGLTALRDSTSVYFGLSPKERVGWLVGFGFNGPLRQYFSLYRAVSQREGERGEKG